jgi:hypothetical protein
MTVLAYAVVRNTGPFCGPLPAAPTGEPLHLVAADDLAFACGPPPLGEPGTDFLLGFARTVLALHRMGTVLPLRFGSVGRADQLATKLVARGGEFAADLARLDGREEMTVRFASPDEPAAAGPVAAPASGTDYLLGRRRQYDRADARRRAAERVVAAGRERFAGLFVDLAHDRGTGASSSLAVHFLVPRGGGAAFAAAVSRAADIFPAPARVLGPWPGYHFLTAPSSLLSGARPPE